MLIKSEVKTHRSQLVFFSLCGYRFYTAFKVYPCSKESHNPQLIIFSLTILTVKAAEQVSVLGYLCPCLICLSTRFVM